MTKVIVAGSRSIRDNERVWEAMAVAPFDITEVVHGGARGVDSLADGIADAWGVETTVFRPDYDEHGKKAPLKRNVEMAGYADALVAVWDGDSSGTRHAIETALDHGLDVYVVQTDGSDSDSALSERREQNVDNGGDNGDD